ncbi:MAG: YceI family protein [Acidimicrobiaceae bacterium]|nr:YceI family protein [Acidimicrobiaceae bacterium]MDE0516594.1 YceI family protein [Acidimicrobiaceae bacterium]MDE0655967.1 YceI family protein [Acidimicrobiaceae bacterium]MXZ94313.1 YceI family protein [Acidimicrobiaceae bacterium]MYF42244.1 YceI family protein [Acidimicrobiaceae bacterium]
MRRIRIVIGAVVALVVLIVVVVAVYLLTRDEAPEAVDLETTVARIEAAETAEDGTDTPSATEPAGDDTDTSTADATTDVSTTSSDDDGASAVDTDVSADDDLDSEPATADQTADSLGGLDGVWTVQVADDAGDLQGEPTVSFAGFRVDEVLNSIGDFTAVGRTADVAGSIELSNTALMAATVEVTMSTLRTDNSFRDGRIYGALNTSEYPKAIFTLVEPVELPAGMADGEPFSGSAEGDLTIKGVTNRVAFDLQAQLVGDIIVAVGSSDVVFSDYGVTAPTAPVVVSVEDHGIMEFQLLFTR